MKPYFDSSAAARVDSISRARRRVAGRSHSPAVPDRASSGFCLDPLLDTRLKTSGARDALPPVVELDRFRAAPPAVVIPPAFPPKSPEVDCTIEPCDREALMREIERFLAGSAPVQEGHRVLATVLIVGIPFAAPLAVQLGHERWLEYTTSFATVVLRQIERFGGEPRAETIDGIVSVFDSPARAAQCASAIDSAARHFGFPVRSGLHAGELEWTDRRLTGIAMQVAQRIFELGNSGEILVSSTVRDLVAGSPLAFESVDKRMQTPADQRWGLFRLVTEPRLLDVEAPVPAPVLKTDATSVLSRREREVATLIANGKSNRCIAEELYIASSTVERHVANILNKLGYRSRTQIAAWAVAIGLAVM